MFAVHTSVSNKAIACADMKWVELMSKKSAARAANGRRKIICGDPSQKLRRAGGREVVFRCGKLFCRFDANGSMSRIFETCRSNYLKISTPSISRLDRLCGS